MLSSPQRLSGRLRMDAKLSTGRCFATTASPTLCWLPLRECIFSLAGIVRWCFEVEVPPRVFLLFVCVFGTSPIVLGLLVSPLYPCKPFFRHSHFLMCVFSKKRHLRPFAICYFSSHWLRALLAVTSLLNVPIFWIVALIFRKC